MLVDFTKGFGGEPDFNWREYAEWLKQAYDHQVGQAWLLERENERLRAEIAAATKQPSK